MGVDVDEAGCDQFAPGVDLFLAFPRNLADLGDAAARDGDIGFIEVAALAIGNVAAATRSGELVMTVHPGLKFC